MTIWKIFSVPSLKKWSNLHYWITVLLMVGLIPCLRRMNLPLKFDWLRLSVAYWIVLSANAISFATILCLVGVEPRKTFGPALRRFKDEKLRIVTVFAFLFLLHYALTWRMAIALTVDAVAALEFFQRIRPGGKGRVLLSVLLPACYLFAGWLLVFAYNDIIVSARFFASKDQAFNAADLWLLHQTSVAQICHWAVKAFPISVFRFFEFIYYSMFSLLGAGLILVSLFDGTRRGLKFVGTAMLPSYVALLLFYLWPSQGPYYLCPTHFADFPASLKTYSLQRESIDKAWARWQHVPLDRLSGDYFIAFPCMHISFPIVVTWFLKRSNRILVFLLAYDVLITVAIILLEWHYVVDILAGILIAALSIWIINFEDLLGKRLVNSPQIC